MKKFVIVVDMQKDFVDANGKLYVKGSADIVKPVNDYLANLNPNEVVGVLFTYDTHSEDTYLTSEEAKQFPPHCYKGTDGWELGVDKTLVRPEIPVFTLEKNVFNMWEESELIINDYRLKIVVTNHDRDYFFKNIGVTNVDVVGVASDFCVKWAIDGLLDRGFNVTVPRALVKGIFETIDEVAENLINPITIV